MFCAPDGMTTVIITEIVLLEIWMLICGSTTRTLREWGLPPIDRLPQKLTVCASTNLGLAIESSGRPARRVGLPFPVDLRHILDGLRHQLVVFPHRLAMYEVHAMHRSQP